MSNEKSLNKIIPIRKSGVHIPYNVRDIKLNFSEL